MKKYNLLRMVVLILSVNLILLGCTSTNDNSLDEPDLVTEVEGALEGELDEIDEDGDIEVSEGPSDFSDDDISQDFDDNDSDFDAAEDDTSDFENDSTNVAALDDDFESDSDFDSDANGEDFSSAEGDGDFDDFGSDDITPEPLAQSVPVEEPFENNEVESSFEEPVPTVAAASLIESIDFKAAEGGNGIVVMSTSSPVEISQRDYPEKRQLIIDIANAKIKKSLERPFIMKDFNGTPFAGVNAYSQKGTKAVSVVIQMKPGATLPDVQQEGNSILVMASGGISVAEGSEPTPDEAVEEEPEEAAVSGDFAGKGIMSAANFHDFLMSNERYYGKPISIQANQVNIRELLNFISEESGANIIISKKVKGEVSIKLREVPWDQALVTIMKSNSLGYVREGSVLRIATLKELEDIAKQIYNTQKNIDGLSPKKVKLFSINYADVKFLTNKIKPLLTPKTGIAVPDARTSSIYVNDNQRAISRVTKLIKELDRAPAQVMIEGKIVEARESFIKQVGVNWSATGGTSILSPDGGPLGAPTILSPSVNISPLGAAQDLTSVGGIFNLTVGTLKNIGNLSATLAMSEQENLTKILSSPRIIAMNKERAEISQESQVLSITSSVNNGTVTKIIQRTPVRLRLLVTPQITNNGTVLMDFEVNRAFAGAVEDKETLARSVNNRRAKSKILVKSGETAVIGGIYDTLGANSEQGPLGLKDIPIIGWLFKSKVKETIKNELLIFLTPKILQRG